MSIYLDELEALARAATPGPWSTLPRGKPIHAWHIVSDAVASEELATVWEAAGHDAAFIAAASPSAVLRLIANLRDAMEKP